MHLPDMSSLSPTARVILGLLAWQARTGYEIKQVTDRSTRFFGTDFSFEDLEERVAAQYDHALVGEEIIDGAPTWNIQATAKSSRCRGAFTA